MDHDKDRGQGHMISMGYGRFTAMGGFRRAFSPGNGVLAPPAAASQPFEASRLAWSHHQSFCLAAFDHRQRVGSVTEITQSGLALTSDVDPDPQGQEAAKYIMMQT